MNFDFKHLSFTTFQKNIATLFSGTFIAQIISTVGALFLAKMYAPELYGTYSIFLSFVSILTIVNSIKLEYIIVIDKTEKNSINVLNALFYIIFFISLLQILFFTIFKDVLNSSRITYIILILSSIASFILSNTKALESLVTRKSFFKTIASARIITAISTITFQFIFFYYNKSGLIYGYMISAIIVLLFYIFNSKNIFHFPNLELLKNTLKFHKNIVKYAFPSGVVNTIAISIMPILLFSYFSPESSGVYALSLKVVSVPLFLVSSSVSQVYFQKASSFYNTSKHKLYDLTKKIVRSNILIMLVILVLINTLGIFLLDLFFDNNWKDLNIFVLILSFYILGQVSFAPVSSIIVITNKMHIGFIFNICLLFINLIAIYIGSIYDNIIYTILILSILGGLSYIVLLRYFLAYLKKMKNGE